MAGDDDTKTEAFPDIRLLTQVGIGVLDPAGTRAVTLEPTVQERL